MGSHSKNNYESQLSFEAQRLKESLEVRNEIQRVRGEI